jgi:hypothetical protein
MNANVIPKDLPRGATGYPCDCNGYCDRVDCTEEECKKHGCFRDSPGMECCAIAFVCRLCGKRWAGTREAPEME